MGKTEIIEKAVDWWTDKISCRHHHDNGDDTGASGLAMIMADMLYKPATQEQIDTFKNNLKNCIEREYEEMEKRGCGTVWLGCDYAPCTILRDSATAAGICLDNFPYKTDMLIAIDKVCVSDGYAQPYEELK